MSLLNSLNALVHFRQQWALCLGSNDFRKVWVFTWGQPECKNCPLGSVVSRISTDRIKIQGSLTLLYKGMFIYVYVSMSIHPCLIPIFYVLELLLCPTHLLYQSIWLLSCVVSRSRPDWSKFPKNHPHLEFGSEIHSFCDCPHLLLPDNTDSRLFCNIYDCLCRIILAFHNCLHLPVSRWGFDQSNDK